MTLCQTELIGERNGKHLHRCMVCGREFPSKYADPQMLKAVCRKAPAASVDERGPGKELEKLISECGLSSFGCSSCKELTTLMNAWGVDGCRERRAFIIADIEKRAAKVNWWTKSKAALSLIQEPWWSVADPIGSLVDEAIRRTTDRP